MSASPNEKSTVAALATDQSAPDLEQMLKELAELHNAAYGVQCIGRVLSGYEDIDGYEVGGLGNALDVLGDLIQRRMIQYLDHFGLDPYSKPSDIQKEAREHIAHQLGGSRSE